MSVANLLDFLVQEQGEKVDLTHAAQLIENYEVDETGTRTALTRTQTSNLVYQTLIYSSVKSLKLIFAI